MSIVYTLRKPGGPVWLEGEDRDWILLFKEPDDVLMYYNEPPNIGLSGAEYPDLAGPGGHTIIAEGRQIEQMPNPSSPLHFLRDRL